MVSARRWAGRAKWALVDLVVPKSSRLNLWLHDPTRSSLALRQRIAAARHGFRAYTAKFYDLPTVDTELYLNDLQRDAMRRITPEYNIVFDDKLLAQAVFGKVLKTPRTIAYLDQDQIVDGTGTTLTVSDLLASIRGEGKVALKTVLGAGGSGVKILSLDNDVLLADGKILADPSSFLREQRSSFVTSFVHQHAYASELFPGSVNTIRLLTLRDPEIKAVFLAGALQRIGNNRSAPVDNFSRGGLSVAIDLATGTLKRAAECDKYTGTVRFIEHHPDTAAQITGKFIPNWPVVIESVIRAHSIFSQAPIIAWDVSLDETAEPVLIEANASTDVDLFQVHEPMLSDARVRRFFQHYGIVAA